MLEAAADRLVRRLDRQDLPDLVLPAGDRPPANRCAALLECQGRHPARDGAGDRSPETVDDPSGHDHRDNHRGDDDGRDDGGDDDHRGAAAAAPPATTTTASPGRPKPKGIAKALDKLNPGKADAFPLPLLILGALAILLVAAGIIGMIWRRMDRDGTGPGDPGPWAEHAVAGRPNNRLTPSVPRADRRGRDCRGSRWAVGI